MSTKFYNNIEEQVKFAILKDGTLKTVQEARNNLKNIIRHALDELNTLMEVNESIDKMIASGEFLQSSNYEDLCTESVKHYHEIHNLAVIKNFTLLTGLLECPDLELVRLADNLIYLIHLHEDDIKARQSMTFSRFFVK